MANEKQKLHIIVQAGGRGSRLRHHTWNKPKCLVSINGKPILYHIFDSFDNASFYVVGDYKFEELANYLDVNTPNAPVELIQASGKGTLSGIKQALESIPDDEAFVIVWSDLYLKKHVNFDATETKPVMGLTSDFICRWVYDSKEGLIEQPRDTDGVAGLFWFPNKASLKDIPSEGEFVKWYSKNIKSFSCKRITNLEELGDFCTIEEKNSQPAFCRFFNSVEFEGDKVVKKVIDDDYKKVHENEIAWYEAASTLGFKKIPKVHSTSPLVLDRIYGQHPYQINDFSRCERETLIRDVLKTLDDLHSLGKQKGVHSECKDVYLNKAISRLNEVRKIIPMFNKDSLTINGLKCKNYFSERYLPELEHIVSENLCTDVFNPIHGDPTFSNMIYSDNREVYLIDPRGSFMKPGIFGDRFYDYAKVYYSTFGGYDFFNRKKFKLYLDLDISEVLMENSAFKTEADEIFTEKFGKNMYKIKLIHALIWVALTGYAKDDFDSSIASFHLGLFHLNEAINEYE